MGVVITVLITIVSVLILVDQFTRGYARSEAEMRLKQLAWQMQDALERGMAERQIDLRILVTRPSIRAAKDLPHMREILNELQASVPNYAWIGMAAPDGTVLVATNGLLEGQSVAERPWFKEGLENLYSTDYHPALLLEQKLPPQPEPWRFVDISSPVKDKEGHVVGVVGMHLSWVWARDIAARLIDPAAARYGVEVMIVRSDGTVMLGPKELEEKKIDTDSFRASQKAQGGGAVLERWPDGRHYITGFSRTGQDARMPLKWSVMVRQPEYVALEAFHNLQQRVILVGALIGVVLVILAYVLTRRLVGPVNDLSAALELRTAGAQDVQIPLVNSYREVQLLSSSLVNMVEREETYLREMRSLNESLEQRVAERTSRLHETAIALQQSLDLQHANQIKLAESADELRAILENAQDAFIAADENGVIVEWNRQAELLLGWMRTEAVGRQMAELIIPQDMREAHHRGMKGFLENGTSVVINNRIELQALHHDGHELPVEITVGHVKRHNGHLFIAFLHDITERLAFRDQMRELALTDMLTNLPNRRAFSDRLPEAMMRARRAHQLMALFFMDIDGFKGVNDRYGHEAGDELLVQFAQRLQSSVRDVDTVARLAGDEFVVILEKLQTQQDALNVADKILNAMRVPFELTHSRINVSSSIGVAIYFPDEDGETGPEELLAMADKAMYAAKRLGKNRVEVGKIANA
ncbi:MULTISPECIES: diguanylate cyclase domain-containing protein [unclassified Herbaspirillum]|uniref:diguanylate cyclase domain-containing protein n=1 Tax=unclassified Herbaspirillum TaxID=2624150 RepID=UPI00116EAA07|nr:MULTISPECIES: diguanylate cyclase [unclassified Herbaspirillum]MBB5391555.1 diguanylate cyclase (GGDEF)-like protein/PAS domain S-box-containing protein [Herbaspirillum sp. SJZ102]TQK12762.1 PAS domain S-box-containing protein/diguanylate cyclase (GGDEF)-like protein [Herbaspirillum sp. SJZ130]TQK14766.1 PAS domain S-box-containing protein/diguanylate cyclase (GGDEF)-like protein [Herbaspirillum sp. SJZ106]TWC61846.1 PAS domain S-box-containing protein/diguanylate cyclase (GGDEF)-like protei